MSQENSYDLGHEKTSKLLWKYFVPAFIGLMVQTLYNVVDRIFIGQFVSVNAIAGLYLIFPIILIVIAFGTLTGIGTGILVSINMGENDFNKAENVLGTGFLTQSIMAILITAIAFYSQKTILNWFNPSAETLNYALDYFGIILWGFILQMTGWGMNNVIRSQGYAKIAMWSMIVSAITNLGLDALFIIVFDWGVQGAAWATLISQFVLSAWVMYHLTKKKASVRLKLPKIRIKLPLLKEIMGVGFASFAMHIAAAVITIIQNDALLKYGSDIAVAAMGVISSISQMIFMAIISVNMAAQPIIGFNHGAADYGRVKSTTITAIRWASYIAILGFIIGEFMPGTMIKLFNTEDTALWEVGRRGMRICFILFPTLGFQASVSNYYQAVGQAKIAGFLSVLRQVIFLIPLFFILPIFYGLDGIWMSWPISDGLAFLVTLTFFMRSWRKIGTQK